MSFMIANIKGPISQITYSLLSSFGGAATGMFFFAAFCPWANSKGAVTGGMTGMAIVLWIALGQNFSTTISRPPTLPSAPTDMCQNDISTNITILTSLEFAYNVTNYPHGATLSPTLHSGNHGLDKLYSISYLWLTPLSILTTILVGSIVSILTGRPDPSEVDVKYMLPFFDYYVPCLPERLRKILHCGAVFKKREDIVVNSDSGNENEKLALQLEDGGAYKEKNIVQSPETKLI
ncbi:sodium-dependent multivitamin transporter-like [Pecten maximus]|uniref:sodium-dependent multivitamin transporter-like n=1 Tax=Pecten maximus TaxID=6579 RepID=UPI0014583947|nr:sodium-dependent multivitamin transporter-like [Pecten maximus]